MKNAYHWQPASSNINNFSLLTKYWPIVLYSDIIVWLTIPTASQSIQIISLSWCTTSACMYVCMLQQQQQQHHIYLQNCLRVINIIQLKLKLQQKVKTSLAATTYSDIYFKEAVAATTAIKQWTKKKRIQLK